MIRKWVFGGLTIVLVAALAVLIIQGHRLEKEKANQPVEIIQKSTPTATRAFAPKDIQLLDSNMRIEETSDASSQSWIARHEIELKNSGTIAYEKIQLSFDYLDGRGETLTSKTHSVSQEILPGSTIKLDDIVIDDIPPQASDFRVAVVYADIMSRSVSQNPRGQGAKG
jgi:hypothetical protein